MACVEELALDANRLRMLIVEDEAAHAEAIRRAFDTAGVAAEIQVADTLREYRAQVTASPPDIALVDLNLPDGRAVEILSSPPETGAFPVLIMTSYGNEQIAVEALKSGALDYVVKSAGAFAAMPRVVARALREWNLLREHQKAERALRQSELRFRTVARLSSDFAYSCVRTGAGDCVVDWITDAFYALTGFTEAELREHGNWLFVAHPEDRAVAGEPLRRLQPGEADAREFRIVTRDGRIRWFVNRMECETEPETPGGLRFFGAVRDVSERRRAEDEMRRSNADLERRVRQRTAQLQTLNKELEAFAYSIAHDLKAPLRGIDGYSRLLLEGYASRLDADGRAFLTHIRQGVSRMGMLIEDLLAYSRLERRALQSGPVELENLARSVVAERAAEIQARGIELRLELPALTVRAADPDGLGQALRNLLDNALKFSRDGSTSTVEIGGRPEQDRIVLWVKDNGIGFDMRFHDRIFEIFQRLHRAEDYPGTGIGLAIVRKAVQRLGGRVWAESAPGAGATFYLELPT